MIDVVIVFQTLRADFLKSREVLGWHHPVCTEKSAAVPGILSQAGSLARFPCAWLGVLIPLTSSASPGLTIARCCCAGFSISHPAPPGGNIPAFIALFPRSDHRAAPQRRRLCPHAARRSPGQLL